MKIAMYTDSYTPYVSGVVRSIQRFTNGLTELGHEVYIFAPAYGRQIHKEEPNIFRFHSVPAPTFPEFSLPIPFSIRADKLLDRLGIDLIHTHSPFLMGRLGAVLARKNKLPLVFTHHTLYHEYTHYVPGPTKITKRMVIKFLKRYCRHCSHIITPTPHIKELIIELYQTDKPITPIPSGIDIAPYKTADQNWLKNKFKLAANTKVLLFVGRLGKEKSPLLTLKAFHLLRRKVTDIHLVFVGDGPEKDNLQQWAEQQNISSYVHFTGLLNARNVINSYSSADLFIFSSVTETQGLVTIEAMAGGLPVVAVNASGTNDMVTHGFDGYLTEETSESLADYANELLTNYSLYYTMRQNALKTARKFSLENTSQKLVNVYQKILNESSSTGIRYPKS